MKTDPNLDLHLDSDVAEVGGTVSGRIRRWPSDGDDSSKKIGKVKAVRIKVSWRTEGRGDRDGGTIGEVTIPAADFGQVSGQFSFPVPPNAPISYDGKLIRVIWKIEARTDRKLALDPKNAFRLLVVPQNGSGRYDRPHPLPDSPDSLPAPQPDQSSYNPATPFTSQQVGETSNQPDDLDETGRDPFVARPDYLDDPSF